MGVEKSGKTINVQELLSEVVTHIKATVQNTVDSFICLCRDMVAKAQQHAIARSAISWKR